MLPSCVPATPFENSGAVLEAEELKKLMDEERVNRFRGDDELSRSYKWR